ncbi:beta-lactamase-like protein, partial [Mycena metata]
MQLLSLAVLVSLISSTISCGGHGHIQARNAPQFDLLPASAAGDPLNSDGYFTQLLGNGTYMITDGIFNCMFLVSTEGVIVVDVPASTGHRLFLAIGNVTHQPITHLVYSHMHADHIGGASLVTARYPRAIIIAHSATQAYLTKLADSNRPVPQVTFDTSYTLRVGNQTLELDYKGAAHIDGNLFMFAPAPKALMVVDIVFPAWIPYSELGQAQDLYEYIRAHDLILEYDFDYYLGGHVGRAGNRTDVLVNKEYVGDLVTNCLAAINLTTTNDPVLGEAALLGPVMASNPGNSWALSRVWTDATTAWCANKTNEKWEHRLAAADVYQNDNAGLVIRSLTVDYGVLGPFGVS